MNPVDFTVLMAVYGGDDPSLFERAVASVVHNTLKPDDFVLVVDGPVPVAIESQVRRLEENGAVRVSRLHENRGLAHALNTGLGLVRTEWVFRADADDVNRLDRFERQADVIRRRGTDVDVFGGAIVEVDRDGVALALRTVPLDHQGIVRRLKYRSPFNHMTVAFRTKLVLDVGGYPDIRLKEDYALWAQLIAADARCFNLDDVLVHATAGREMYRRRGGVRYAHSEWRLQALFVQLGVQNSAVALAVGALRACAALAPSWVRRWVYERHLRKRPHGRL